MLRRTLPFALVSSALLALVGACVGDAVYLGELGPGPAADPSADVPVQLVPLPASASAAAVGTALPDCDHDADGYESIACGGTDCDDNAQNVHPDAPEAEDWNVEVVAADASMPSIAVDPRGVVHLAVRARVSGGAALRTLTRTADGWLSEDVASLSEGPWAPDIAVGPDHHIHVCWTTTDGEMTNIGHAVTVGHRWHSETLLSAPGDPSGCSVAVDEHGAVHVALQDPASRTLRHGVLINNAWTFDPVDVRTGAGAFPVMLIDSWYVPSIGYQDAEGRVRHAARSATGWHVATVDEAGLLPAAPFLGGFAVDPEGFVHVSYRQGHLRSLAYATNQNGLWEDEVIESAGYSGKSSAIGVDNLGNAHVVYSVDDRFDRPDDLVFRTNAGGSWSAPQVIDDEGSTGFAPRLALRPRGVHVAYFRMGGDGRPEVVHAYRALPDAIDADCDGQF